MTTIPHDPDQLTDHERAVLHLARRVRRYPGHTGWPLYKPGHETPNIPRRSRAVAYSHL